MNELNNKSLKGPSDPTDRPHLHLAPAPATAEARSAAAVDLGRIEAAVRELLLAIGENPDREGLVDTPKRVARAYRELSSGLREDPGEHLGRTFEHPGGELVALRDIEFASLCEHHLLPFIGRAHIAYLPGNGRVVGLSKLARCVEVFARRPQLQERLTGQIADALVHHLQPRGVLVALQAEHLCMKIRGVRKSEPLMASLATRGSLRHDPVQRAEALALLGLGGSASGGNDTGRLLATPACGSEV